MAYINNEKSTGLDVLTSLEQNDLHIVGDVSDSGRAKAITEEDLETTIANSSHFVDELVGNDYFTDELAHNSNFLTQLGSSIISPLEVEENGVSIETNVNKINIISGGSIVSNPATGEVDITITSGGSPVTVTDPSYFDDFMSVYPSSIVKGISHEPDKPFNIGELSWNAAIDITGSGGAGGVVPISGISNHPGIFQLLSGNASCSFVKLGSFDAYNSLPISDISSNGSEYTFIVKPVDGGVPGTSHAYVGIGQFTGNGMVPNSIRVDFVNGNIVFETSNNGSTQTTTVGTYTGTFYNLKITSSGSAISLSINGGTPTVHSTFIPVSGTSGSAYFCSYYSFGIQGDLFSMYKPGIVR